MSNFVSMRVIAEAAGVSKAAVSRVINGRPAGIRISTATRDRILAAVRQFGYQSTRFAQDQAPRRQATIALVLASVGLDASATHLPAIESVVTSNGYRLLLAILPADSGAARDRVAALLKDGIAGFLCAPAVIPAVVEGVAGACPVVVIDAVGGETILRSLGVGIPLPVIPPPVNQPVPVVPPPVIQPVPVAPPPVTQPVPTISPPVIQPAPSVVAAVPGGTVPEPILPMIPVTPAPGPQPLPDLVVSEPASVPEPIPVPVPEPAVIEPSPAPALETEPIPLEPTPEPEPALPSVEPVLAPVSVPEPEPPQAEPVQPSAPTPDPEAAPVPQPEPEPLPPTEPAPTPTPEPTLEPAPIEIPLPTAPPPAIPDPVVEVQVDKSEKTEPKGEDAVPEEDGTVQPDQSIPSLPPEKVSE